MSATSSVAAVGCSAADCGFDPLPHHQDCGFWRPLTESLQRHPRRWGFGALAGAVLLIIILCATIIPMSGNTPAPQFEAQPWVANAGNSWMDVSVRLDRPGLVFYLVLPQASLSATVPGTNLTLLQLLQAGTVPGAAVWAASAPAAALSGNSWPLPGVVTMAVACGWGSVPEAHRDTLVSVLSVSASTSAACSSSSSSSITAAASSTTCARCPRLLDATAYTILAVGVTANGKAVSDTALTNGSTGAAAATVNSVDPPYVDNVTATSFDLNFKPSAPGERGDGCMCKVPLWLPYRKCRLERVAARQQRDCLLTCTCHSTHEISSTGRHALLCCCAGLAAGTCWTRWLCCLLHTAAHQ